MTTFEAVAWANLLYEKLEPRLTEVARLAEYFSTAELYRIIIFVEQR